MRKIAICGALLLMMAAPAFEQTAPSAAAEPNWHVRLLSPLSTPFNRKGDLVSAQVVDPAAFQGGILEGDIRDIRAGDGAGKPAIVQFDLHTLHRSGEVHPVSAALVEVLNSRGQSGRDEVGTTLEFGGHGLGAKVFARGSSGAMRLSAAAPQLYLPAGSELVLQVQLRKHR